MKGISFQDILYNISGMAGYDCAVPPMNIARQRTA